jgi:hypothetical protein
MKEGFVQRLIEQIIKNAYEREREIERERERKKNVFFTIQIRKKKTLFNPVEKWICCFTTLPVSQNMTNMTCTKQMKNKVPRQETALTSL